MKTLEGRRAFIAGGSQGIGEETALLFGREGAKVAVLASSDIAKAERVAHSIRDAGGIASAHSADVRDPEAVRSAVATAVSAHGPIDILINSAGIFPPTPCGANDHDTFDRVMDINVKERGTPSRAIAPSMRARKTGWIVNNSSVLGTMALANYAAYCASKAAVNMLTRSLAIEFGRDGLHVNGIAPGNTATPMNLNLRTEAQYQGLIDMMAARTPSGRTYSQPEEIARMVLYLSCDDGKPVHGAIMVMDEGFSSGV